MKINLYKYAETSDSLKKKLFARSSADYEKVKKQIYPILEEVKRGGDNAITKLNQRFGAPLTSLTVSDQEIDEAYNLINPNFLKSFQVAKNNITAFCLAQKQSLRDRAVVNNRGIKLWRVWKPLDSVGIYVPGGRANYPSTLLMCATPALVAGCKRIIVCCPPKTDGSLPAEVLVTARELGIYEMYKAGGAQAIAAMAYGTQSIKSVQKIVGPGNQYVNAAKLSVWPQTAIDLPAGPSENLIIADQYANPRWVAVDLLTDLEHGPDSAGILLTNSLKLAKQVKAQINKINPTLFSKYSAIIIVNSLAQAIEFANEYAPEHMQIMTNNASYLAKKIVNAGSVFIGPWSAKAGGDYATGANHVLPTGGAAKTSGALSVDSFGKWIEFQQVTKSGFTNIQDSIETYAVVETLPTHKLSATIRRSYEK